MRLLPPAKMTEIIDDLIAMGVKAVTFSGGGEPLLYRSLPAIVERLGRASVKVGALSNGANLQGRMADAFARWGCWLRVSLESWDDASYASARSVPLGAFSRLLDNIRGFAARKSPCALGVSFILGHDNAGPIVDACGLLEQAGVQHVKLTGAIVSTDDAANNRSHRAIASLVRDQIRETKTTLASPDFAVVDHYHERDSHIDKAYTQAGLLGSIKDRLFRDFWYSAENHRQLRSLDPSRACRHHCVAHRKNVMLQELLTLDRDHACFV